MGPIPNTKRNRALVIWIPLAFYLVINTLVTLLWRHPRPPAYPTPESEQAFIQAIQRDMRLQEKFFMFLLAIPTIGVTLGNSLLAKQPVEETSTNPKLAVLIDAKWNKIVRSPLYFIVAALTGVAGICPFIVFFCGMGMLGKWGYALALLCWVVIFGVLLFYSRLAGSVIAELYKMPHSAVGQSESVTSLRSDMLPVSDTAEGVQPSSTDVSRWSQASGNAASAAVESDSVTASIGQINR